MNPPALALAARVLLVMAIGLVTHLATTDRSYPLVDDVPDKVNHVLAFGVLSLLADFSFPASRFGTAKVLALLGYGALIELVQHFLPFREAFFMDIVADATGIALYAIAMAAVLRAGLRHRVEALRRPP